MRAKETIDTQMKTEAKIAALTTNKKQSTMTTTSTNSRQNTSFTNHIDNCRYCGRQHPPRKCPAYGKQCSNCSKKNHFAAVCQQRTRTANEINVEQDSIASANSINAEFYISNGDLVADCVDSTNFNTVSVDGFSIESISNLANEWLINVNDNVLKIKVDTGEQANVICEAELKKVAPNSIVRPSHVALTAYSGHKLPVTGITELTVSYNGAIQVIPFHVLGGGLRARTLLGLPSIKQLGLLTDIDTVSSNNQAVDAGECNIISEFQDVFHGLGKLKAVHKIVLKPDAEPSTCSLRSVPFALRDKLKEELKRLQSLDIIAECKGPTDWLNPIVPVLKPDGSIRICLDPQKLNAATIRDRYSLPKISDIHVRLAGSKVYTTLDARSGFHQIPLDEESSKLTTFLTPCGKFSYERLPFGVTSTAEFFSQNSQ